MKAQLFRIQLFDETQGNLFNEITDRTSVLLEVFTNSDHKYENDNGVWTIGNITTHGKYHYFRFGVTKPTDKPVYDKGFHDVEDSTSPYTHVLLNANEQLCVIFAQPKIHPRYEGIASYLTAYGNDRLLKLEIYAELAIDPIYDPTEFVKKVLGSKKITRFALSVRRPNFFDPRLDFIEPFRKNVTEFNGRNAKAEVRGNDLNKEKIADTSAALGNTGDDVEVDIVNQDDTRENGLKFKRDNTIRIETDGLDTEDSESRKAAIDKADAIIANVIPVELQVPPYPDEATRSVVDEDSLDGERDSSEQNLLTDGNDENIEA